MRVAMLLDNYFPPISERPYREAKSLILNGYDVDLFCVKDSYQPETDEIDGIGLMRVNKNLFWQGVNKIIHISRELVEPFSDALIQHSKIVNVIYDIIHIHNPPDSLINCALNYKKKINPKVKIIFDFRNPVVPVLMQKPNRFLKPGLLPALYWERKAMFHSDLLIVVSSGAKERLVANGVPKDKVLIVNNFVDLFTFNLKKAKGEAIRSRYQLKNHQVILYPGAMDESHGIDVLLRAVYHLKNKFPKIFLILIGPQNRYWKKINSLIKKLKLDESVMLLPWQNYEDIPNFISAADICVDPRRYSYHMAITSNPNKLFQYMAMKKPIIATRMESITDFVDETCAILVQPGSVESMAHGIAQLLLDPVLRDQLAQTAYNRCVENFTWPTEGQKLVTRYNKLVNNPDG